MKRETSFRVNHVRPFLKSLKHTAYFPIQQQSIRGDADYILCVRGRFVWLELKDERGEPEPLQRLKANNVRKAEGIAIVARPQNWWRVSAFLQQLDEGYYDQDALRRIDEPALPKGGG